MRFRGGRHLKESDRESSGETPVWCSGVGILHFKEVSKALCDKASHAIGIMLGCASSRTRERTSKYEFLKSNKHRKSVMSKGSFKHRFFFENLRALRCARPHPCSSEPPTQRKMLQPQRLKSALSQPYLCQNRNRARNYSFTGRRFFIAFRRRFTSPLAILASALSRI
jgi:hypothetical protein